MKPNPNARNCGNKDPMRRSFSGNLAKSSSVVANSRDFTRSSAFGRENSSSLRDHEDKENSKCSNLRPGRVQSPAFVSKGTNNLMSPAASNFTTSPRNEILVERNVPLRSSVSDFVNLHLTFEISHKTSCSTPTHLVGPLDVDILMPPYDPKTNCLSPRPQFLHYKPIPRIEQMHCEDRDDNLFKKSFISENLSDSEVSESLSEDSKKESEHVSSDEAVKREEEESVEDEEEFNVSKMIATSTHKLKSRFFIRSIFIAIVLALVYTCFSISVANSPVSDLSMVKDLVPTEITEFAKVDFEELARKSRLWARNSLSCDCKLISKLREMHKLGPLQYGNLTSLLEEHHLVDGYPKFGHADSGAEFKYQEHMLAPIKKRYVKVESLAVSLPENETNKEGIEANEEISEEDNDAEFERQVHQDIDEIHDNVDVVEDHTEADSEEACVTPPPEEIEPVNSEADQTKETTVEFYVDNDAKPQSNIYVATVDSFFIKNIVGISLLALLSLLAVAAFFQTKKLTTPNAPAVQSVVIKSSSYFHGSFTTYEKIPSKHGFGDGVVTRVRRSCRIRRQVTSP